MHRKLKQFLCLFVIVFSFGTVSTFANNASEEISVEINGSQFEIDSKIIENTTFVPLRDISNALDVAIDWNEQTKTIDVYGDDVYTLEIENQTVTSKKSGTFLLTSPPRIIENKTFVPIRFIAESTGATVLWNDTSKTVSIIKSDLEKIELSLGNKKIHTGETLSKLIKDFGNPSRIDKGMYNLDWYIYNQDYTQFIMVAVQDKTVVGYYTNAKGFVLNDDIKYDAVYSENDNKQIKVYSDKNNNDKIYAVLVVLLPYQNETEEDSQQFLEAQAIENFDILNTFRTNYGMSTLKWDELLVESSKAHCIDMAENGYFSHNSLDGRTHKDRILATGIKDTIAWGENIVGGRSFSVETFDLWVNSAGHRENMLRKNFTHVGIASIFKEGSVYTHYSGQNFVEKEEHKSGVTFRF